MRRVLDAYPGHVAAFGMMGGLPYGHVRYDNLSPAVARVLTGRSRTEMARSLSFRAHYGFVRERLLRARPPSSRSRGCSSGQVSLSLPASLWSCSGRAPA